MYYQIGKPKTSTVYSFCWGYGKANTLRSSWFLNN